MSCVGRVLTGAPLTATAPPLVIISDCLLQPGILVLRQIIDSALARGEHVVLAALEQPARRLLPVNHDASRVQLVVDDGDAATLASNVDALRDALLAAMKRCVPAGPTLVVFDSVTELLDRFGSSAAYTVLRLVLKTLAQSSSLSRPGSRLVAIHHNHFPSLPSSASTASHLAPSPLAMLLSPSLSSATVHMTLHPCAYLEILSSEYGLHVPLDPVVASEEALDARVPALLASLASRSHGDPLVRPRSTRDDDERLPLDALGRRVDTDGSGGCIVEWTARGVAVPSSSAAAASSASDKRGEPRKVVRHGIEGLKRTERGVRAADLAEVLRPEKMSNTNLVTATRAGASKTAPPDPALLPFNLSLTDAQKSARDGVALPFMPRDGVGTTGAGAKVDVGGGGGGGGGGGADIDYVPDEGDDMDDDDPDEDLEI